MKTLLILRHGKAEEHNTRADRQRNLIERGRDDAERIGEELHRRGILPDLIVSSDAARAEQTALLCAEKCGYDGEIETAPQIYDSGADVILKVMRTCSDAAGSVLLVGHNPSLEELVARLADPLGNSGAVVRLPTAGLAALALEIDSWAHLAPGSGKLLWQIDPRSLS